MLRSVYIHVEWITWSRNEAGSSSSTFVINFFHVGAMQISFKKNHWIFKMVAQDFCLFLCRGRRIHTSGHSDFGILSNMGASSIFTKVYADTASAACPSQSSSLAMTSITLAAVIWGADEPCSVKTALAPESSFTMLGTRLVLYTSEIWVF